VSASTEKCTHLQLISNWKDKISDDSELFKNLRKRSNKQIFNLLKETYKLDSIRLQEERGAQIPSCNNIKILHLYEQLLHLRRPVHKVQSTFEYHA
jgi:hypothetical protein